MILGKLPNLSETHFLICETEIIISVLRTSQRCGEDQMSVTDSIMGIILWLWYDIIKIYLSKKSSLHLCWVIKAGINSLKSQTFRSGQVGIFSPQYHVDGLLLYAYLISFILDPAATWWPWQLTQPLWVSAFFSCKVGRNNPPSKTFPFLIVSTFKTLSLRHGGHCFLRWSSTLSQQLLIK